MLKPDGKFDGAKRATTAAIDELIDGTYFAIVAGTGQAAPIFPTDGMPVRASASTRAAAARAVDGLRPNGGTAMGTWLAYVRGIVGRHPGALTHAIRSANPDLAAGIELDHDAEGLGGRGRTGIDPGWVHRSSHRGATLTYRS